MMTTIRKAIEILAESDAERIAFPMPEYIKIGKHDVMAAKLLLWLEEQATETQTVGDTVDILNAAMWWHTLFSSIYKQPKKEQETNP